MSLRFYIVDTDNMWLNRLLLITEKFNVNHPLIYSVCRLQKIDLQRIWRSVFTIWLRFGDPWCCRDLRERPLFPLTLVGSLWHEMCFCGRVPTSGARYIWCNKAFTRESGSKEQVGFPLVLFPSTCPSLPQMPFCGTEPIVITPRTLFFSFPSEVPSPTVFVGRQKPNRFISEVFLV
jgi:hypothetical protein